MKSFESRLTIFLSYSFIQRARTRARSFQCLYKGDTATERAPNATPTKTSATEEEFKRRATTKTIADSRSTRTPLYTKSSGKRTTAREVSGGKEDGATKTPSNGSGSGKMGENGGDGPTATYSDSHYVTGGPPDGMKTRKCTSEEDLKYGDDGTTDTGHSRPGDTSESTGSIKGQDDKDTSAAENHGPATNKYSPTPDSATKTPEGTAGTTKDPKQPNTVAIQDLKLSSSKTANYPEKQTAGPDQSPGDPGESTSAKHGDAKTTGDDKLSDAGNSPLTPETTPNDGRGEDGEATATAAVATDTSNTNADPADNVYTTTNTKTDTKSDKGNTTGSSAGEKSAGEKSAGNNPPTTEKAPNDGMGKNGGTTATAAVATDTSNTNADPADNDYTTTNTKTNTNSDKGNDDVPQCNSTSGRRCIFPYYFNMAVSSNFLLKAELPRRNQFSI